MPLTGTHLLIVLLLLVVLVVFGPKRLPELGSAMGRALREFRSATTELREQVTDATHPNTESRTEPATTVTSASAAPTETATQSEPRQ